MSITAGVGVMTTTDKRDAAVGELLRTEAAYVSDMKVCVPLGSWKEGFVTARLRLWRLKEGQKKACFAVGLDCPMQTRWYGERNQKHSRLTALAEVRSNHGEKSDLIFL